MSEDIKIKWLEPCPLNLIGKEGAKPSLDGGGVYFWYWSSTPNSPPAVVYVGESDNFGRRMCEHIANTLGHGGTIFLFDEHDEDPYGSLEKELERSVPQKKPPRYRHDTKKIYVAIGHESLPEGDGSYVDVVSKRMPRVLDYLSKITVLCGVLEGDSFDKRQEIEGGILDVLMERHQIGVWPGGRANDYLIGTRSKICRNRYNLKHGGHGKKVAVEIFGEPARQRLLQQL
jgi:hypothetical protein